MVALSYSKDRPITLVDGRPRWLNQDDEEKYKPEPITLTVGLPSWFRYFLFENCGLQFGLDDIPTDADLISAMVGSDEPVNCVTHTAPLEHSFGFCKSAAISVIECDTEVIKNLQASIPQDSLISLDGGFAVLTVAPWLPNMTMKMFGGLYGQ